MHVKTPISFREKLFNAGLLIETEVKGIYGFSEGFNYVIRFIDNIVSEMGFKDNAQSVRFPPVIKRSLVERCGYLEKFPHLAGTVYSFCGDDCAHAQMQLAMAAGDDPTNFQQPTDVMLTPAACYPIYPMISELSPLPQGGVVFDVQSTCYRNEPSDDPVRMQSFRMREYVRAGEEMEVLEFRNVWMRRAQEFCSELGLDFEIKVANDPFFGRSGRLLADNQRKNSLKYELLIPVSNWEEPTACASFNYHEDHFGEIWSIRTATGNVAKSACVSFGYERLALALIAHHGTSINSWLPASVRAGMV
ncbi:amino acid--[acyl-carrier-protein] ligase [Microbulbifer sp. A4B17]|uniref:amino acid--[acyl-carrier-protein] ligase n=1 Tax=Microbulbifer sp. A4B17 TaxID=359370 RepID=UPI000D52A982|nr:amino acid--[acyl-carrier-protein] ligase [Microbulbifer sp. A4B17]AWF80219.1 amino acid--[acyl-carrier-protein] ligase [Microbulbifer sp. A4B17]